jgi:hypothetical protein
MVVNVSKTNYIIFHNRGKRVDLNGCKVVFNSNDVDVAIPDPALVQKIERKHNKHGDPKMQSFKLLGVYLDEYLTLNKHVDHVTTKLSRALNLLNRIKQFVSLNSLRKLYFSLFHSHLLCCINILSCTSQANLNRITVLQKKPLELLQKPTIKPTQHHCS